MRQYQSKPTHKATQQHTERKLLVNARPDDIRVDDQTVGHIVQGEEDGVSQQELGAVSIVIVGSKARRLTISGISMRRMAPAFVSMKAFISSHEAGGRAGKGRKRIEAARGKLTVIETARGSQRINTSLGI
jgi:hypothetical protein